MVAIGRKAPPAKLLWLVTTLNQIIGITTLRSVPTYLDPHMSSTFLPNVRESIDDYYLRYYKYDQTYEVAPVSGNPTYLHEFAHMAAIGWTKANGTIDWNCGGTLIWENYVLTAAHCAADEKNAIGEVSSRAERNSIVSNAVPDVVRLGDINLYDTSDDQFAQQLKIVEIIRHPEHRFSSRYHDLALLRLEKYVTVHDTVSPGCLWNDEEIPFRTLEATGWGATGFEWSFKPYACATRYIHLREYEPDIVLSKSDDTEWIDLSRARLSSQITALSSEATFRNGTNCSIPETYLPKLASGLTREHLCFGNELFLVPETCELQFGAPLLRSIERLARILEHVYALNLFAKDCGFGRSAVATRLGAHLEWMNTILLPSYAESAVHFFNKDFEEFDHCTAADGSGGLCTHVYRCPKIAYDVKND
uniref:Peptidase S1 domain-containing protein n=1 Tax=Anopheles farauti TaxID=69004 RepID=A0A182Q8N9_9DIPT